MVLVSAPGKIILFGEHSVVYGGCAIGFAINKRIFVDINKANNKVVYPNDYIKETVELLYKITKIRDLYNFDIRIEKSEIPIGRGLGSSAAMVVSTIVGLNEELNLGLDNNVIPIIGKEVEKNIQGFASGFDPMVSYYGGSIFYKIGMKKDLNPDIFPKFYIMDTGITSYTKDMVKNVAVMKKKYKNIVENIFDNIDRICYYAVDNLGNKEIISELMNINQGFLYSIGVSSPETEQVISDLKINKGAIGSKITGAGNGYIISILKSGESNLTISKDGAKIENNSIFLK